MRAKFALLIAVLILSSTIVIHAQDYRRFINCGARDSVMSGGIVWESDKPFGLLDAGYIGGERSSGDWGAGNVGGTVFRAIFISQRARFSSYKFVVPSEGYIVTLYLSENHFNGPGRRIFRIEAEDSVIIDGIDLYAYVGRDYAVSVRFFIEVYDETLTVKLPTYIGEPLLAGISVISAEPDSTPPHTPLWIKATSGYNCVIVNWPCSPEVDVAGYVVIRQEIGGSLVIITPEGTPLYRHIDTTAVPGINYIYSVIAYDVFGNFSSASMPSETCTALVPGTSDLPMYKLFITPDQLELLADNPWSNEYVYGSFRYDGGFWTYVEIRHRGNVSRAVSKKNWKIKFSDARLFFDELKLNLNSEFKDPTFLKNHCGYNLYRWANIEAPYANFVSMWLNDEYYGVYVQLEQVDEAYLRHRGFSEEDPIYKANWLAFYELDNYSWGWEIETGDEGFGVLEDMIKLITRTPDYEMEEVFDSTFDVENILRYFAIITLTSDNDFTLHNILMHREQVTGVWRIIPWDHNVAFGLPPSRYPIGLGTHYFTKTIGGPSLLMTRLFRINSYRNRFCDLLDSLSLTLFTVDNMENYVDSVTNYIRTDVYADYRKGTYEDNFAWEWFVDRFTEYFEDRINYIRYNIDDFREPLNQKGIYINEICASNSSVIHDDFGEYDDWVELYNSNSYPINLEDFYLSDRLDSLILWKLPDINIEAESYIILWLDRQPGQGNLHGPFRLAREGEFIGLFDDKGPGSHSYWGRFPPAIDLLWFGEQITDMTWSRIPDGSEDWGFSIPTPGGENISGIACRGKGLPENLTIMVFPNPFNSSCRIAAPMGSNVEIFDLKGRIVCSFSRTVIDESSLQWLPDESVGSGVYLVMVSLGNQKVSRKVVYMK